MIRPVTEVVIRLRPCEESAAVAKLIIEEARLIAPWLWRGAETVDNSQSVRIVTLQEMFENYPEVGVEW